MSCSEPLPPLPPHFVAFAWRYHPVRLFSFLPCGPTPATGPGAFGFGSSTPTVTDWRRQGLPGSWGILMCLCPVLRPRQDRTHQATTVCRRGPRTIVRRRLPQDGNFGVQWQGLDTRCLTLRRRGHPRTTPDALPAAGQALPGRIGYLQDPAERFLKCVLHPVLLSQASWRKPRPLFPA
jgi:hypothetical protein